LVLLGITSYYPFIPGFPLNSSKSPYPKAFETLEDARQWIGAFVNWYNTEHMHSSIGYVTPHQMRYGQAKAIFEQRNGTLQLAREIHPERWGSRPAREWSINREVVLNPDEK